MDLSEESDTGGDPQRRRIRAPRGNEITKLADRILNVGTYEGLLEERECRIGLQQAHIPQGAWRD
jgi:hypothetical protein